MFLLPRGATETKVSISPAFLVSTAAAVSTRFGQSNQEANDNRKRYVVATPVNGRLETRFFHRKKFLYEICMTREVYLRRLDFASGKRSIALILEYPIYNEALSFHRIPTSRAAPKSPPSPSPGGDCVCALSRCMVAAG
jgi:hypothetical protein